MKHIEKLGYAPVRIIKNGRRHAAYHLVDGKVTRIPIKEAEKIIGRRFSHATKVEGKVEAQNELED